MTRPLSHVLPIAVLLAAGALLAVAAVWRCCTGVCLVLGVESFTAPVTEQPTAEQKAKHELGSPDTQAGSHPYELTTTFAIKTKIVGGAPFPEHELKDLTWTSRRADR